MDDQLRILSVLHRANKEMSSTEIIDHDSNLSRFTVAKHLKVLEELECVSRRVVPQEGAAALPRHFFEITQKGRKRLT